MRVRLETAVYRLAGHLKKGRSELGNLSAETIQYLSRDNPRLQQLKERYARFNKWAHSSWTPWEEKVDLLRFRGENDYLSQAYFKDTLKRYEITTAYVEVIDQLGLLQTLSEDTLFGVKTWDILANRPVTRDLLDSIVELTFLQAQLGWTREQPIRVLDVGAGYGRFAFRLTSAFPQSHVTCIDAIPTSTFLCEFYLKFRGSQARTKVVPFDEVDRLSEAKYDLAVNIHSWSECTLEFIKFWLGRIRDLKIPYLFIVPHFADFSTKEADGSNLSYYEELERHGYKQHIHRRKFHRSTVADRFGIYPADYWIFKQVDA